MGTVAPDSRLPSLTGLRFLAALGVFGFHVNVLGLFGERHAAAAVALVFGPGSNGVSFFFILSGFVLTWSARPGAAALDIWRRRAAKIFPNHLVTWLIGIAALAYTSHAVPLINTLPGFVLLQAWIPDPDVYYAANTPAWSLSCEAAFYAAFPLLLRAITRVREARLWPLAGLLVGGVLLLPLAARALPDELAHWFVYIFPMTRALEFAVGIVLARIVGAKRWIRLGLWPAIGIFVSVYAVSATIPGDYTYVARMVIPFAMIIPAAALADLTGHRTGLRGRTFQWLGEISFAFYLAHQLVMRLVDKTFGDFPRATPAALAITLLMLALSLIAADLLHRLVERPVMHHLTTPRRVPLAPEPARHPAVSVPNAARKAGAMGRSRSGKASTRPSTWLPFSTRR